MSGVVDAWARDEVADLDAAGLRRTLEPLDSPPGPHVRLGGRELINFSSNDYLGLADSLELREAVRTAALSTGVGAGASRLVVGDLPLHHALEAALADFKKCESALVFSSGYAANVGALTALVGAGDVVFSDAMNHASLIDGCRLSRAQVVVYPHADVRALERLVAQHPGRRRLVVTDTVFSMDGDHAPVRELAALCRREKLGLLVDEAHATGVLGATGAGLCEALGVTPDVVMGTLSKAIGASGGYLASSATVRALFVNRARSFVFSTGLPPVVCAAALAGLQALRHSERRAQLHQNCARVAAGLGVPHTSAIFSVVLGAPARALEASAALRHRGVLVKAIRPPTVPEGTSRLRISVSAAHSEADIDALLEALQPWLHGARAA
ncbi:MAG: 8-amino-7-oxononanoate synthase [Archangium sp.]|nr:8-amino-7-oxononanoate synthase [Archangium sp.]